MAFCPVLHHVTSQCPANFLNFLQSENIGSPDGDPIIYPKHNRTLYCNAHAHGYDLKISWWLSSSNGFSV